ncbi:MAG: hypothetical protein ACT4OZ_12355 [Gemmatimonadota bacterium]
MNDTSTRIVRHSHFLPLRTKAWLLAVAMGCSEGPERAGTDTLRATAVDSAAQVTTRIPERHAAPRRLPPVADTIAQRLVFFPATQRWFLGAVRDSQFGIDLGRIDIDLQKPPSRLAAFASAAEATSPWEKGTTFRLRGAWGEEDATITAFVAVGNRIIARLALSQLAESVLVVSRRGGGVATAQLVESATPSRESACSREAPEVLTRRLNRAADSLVNILRSGEQPVFDRLRQSLRARKSTIVGCFGAWRGIAIASLSAGDYEWARERAVLVGDSGVRSLTVRDLRYRSHEFLHALDGDGDGVDDVAARAWTPRSSGTVVLRFAEGVRLERLAAGYSTER